MPNKNKIAKQLLQIVVSAFFLSLALTTTAQIDRGKIAYNWVFGINCGITFNTDNCEPGELLINHYYAYYGGSVSISDKDGNLLVYGKSPLYNRLFEPIPNSLLDVSSSLQTSLQIPLPESLNKYYVFQANDELLVTTIDMEMNNGLGGVSELNRLIETEFEPTQTATRHANGRDIWLITHKKDCNIFYVYLITPDGIDLNPIVKSIGTSTAGLFPSGHYMKVSPDGSLLGFSPYESPEFNLFDFNNSTGEISNFRTLDFGNVSMSASQFSQSNRFIYGSLCCAFWGFYQLDLSAGSPTQIVDSKIKLHHQTAGDLQYGANGVLYIAPCAGNKLWAIKHPELQGLACGFGDNAFTFPPATTIVTCCFPQFLQSDLKPTIFTYTNTCSNEPAIFTTAFPDCIDSVKWMFNDLAQSPHDTSTLFNPTFQFSNSGEYNIRHISYRGSLSDTLYKKVTIEASPQIFEIRGGGAYCQGASPNEITLSNSEVGVTYILFKNGVITGTTLNGTGVELNFGEISEIGEYRVKAKRHASSCENWMDGTVTVSLSLPPDVNKIMHN